MCTPWYIKQAGNIESVFKLLVLRSLPFRIGMA